MTEIPAEPQELISPSQSQKLQAMIEAAFPDPESRAGVSIGSAWAIMNLPAPSLGWTERDIPMSPELRMNSVIVHLRLGAIPGFKHIIWMGNGFYPTTAYWAYKVTGEPNLKRITAPEFFPLTPEEKEMFGIQPGDLCCNVKQTVEFNGYQQVWTGTGIVGADDIARRGSNNKPLPGMQSTKDRMKTLKTRAVHDMYSRNYPIVGMTNAAEDLDDGEGRSEPIDVTPIKTIVQSQVVDQENQAKADDARSRFWRLVGQLESMKASVTSIIPTWEEILKAAIAENIHDACDALDHWIQDNSPKPDPEPPKPKKSAPAPKAAAAEPVQAKASEPAKVNKPEAAPAAPAAAEPPVNPKTPTNPRGAGRRPGSRNKPKDGEAVIAVAEIAPEEIQRQVDEAMKKLSSKEPEGLPEKDIWDDGGEAPEDIFVDGASADGIQDEFDQALALEPSLPPEPETYEGTDNQRAILNRAADDAGLDNAARYAMHGAMRGRKMDQVSVVINALQNKSIVPKPEKAGSTTKSTDPTPTKVMAKDSSSLTNNKAITEERQRLKAAIDAAVKAGGAPMHIIGTNPHNIVDGGTITDIKLATEKLTAWMDANTATIDPDAGDVVFPLDGSGSKAYAQLEKWYGSAQATPAAKQKILEVAARKLGDGDHLILPEAMRLANKGDFRKIDEFIASRAARPEGVGI